MRVHPPALVRIFSDLSQLRQYVQQAHLEADPALSQSCPFEVNSGICFPTGDIIAQTIHSKKAVFLQDWQAAHAALRPTAGHVISSSQQR